MENIDILKHFDEVVHEKGITILVLREAERIDFFAKLPKPFRVMYLADEDLEWRIKNAGGVRSEEILTKIPNEPFMMSGEFSELLCYYLVPEKYLPKSNLRPSKWKWKEAKNIPAHFTDVLLFYQIDSSNPHPDDSLISIESKARATRPSDKDSSLQKAIDDARKDATGRLAESLFHLKTRYKDDKNIDALKQLERFMDLAKFPSFLKHFKAIATVDNAFAQTHLDNVSKIPDDVIDSFEVILIKMDNLKLAYEETFTQMANT